MLLLVDNLHEKHIVESQDPFLANQKKGGILSIRMLPIELNY